MAHGNRQVPGRLAVVWDRAPLSQRLLKLLRLAVAVTPLIFWARWRRASLVGQVPVDVSLTSYGRRLKTVYLTIASLGSGTEKPSSVTLYVSDASWLEKPPTAIRRLQERGLQVRISEDFGPHTKYFPYVLEHARKFSRALVTVDDDILYGRKWLSSLFAAYSVEPHSIHAHRLHEMTYNERGELEPYSKWHEVTNTAAKPTNFITGVCGVIYPPCFLRIIAEYGSNFQFCAPKADDVWLTLLAFRSDVPIRQVSPRRSRYPELPANRKMNLRSTNVGAAGNDVQLRQTAALLNLTGTLLRRSDKV